MIWLLALSGLLGFSIGTRLGLFSLFASVFLIAPGAAALALFTESSPFLASIGATVAFEFAALATMFARSLLHRHDTAPIAVSSQPSSYSRGMAKKPTPVRGS